VLGDRFLGLVALEGKQAGVSLAKYTWNLTKESMLAWMDDLLLEKRT